MYYCKASVKTGCVCLVHLEVSYLAQERPANSSVYFSMTDIKRFVIFDRQKNSSESDVCVLPLKRPKLQVFNKMKR